MVQKFGTRINLLISDGLLHRLDALVGPDETRSAVVRRLLEAALKDNTSNANPRRVAMISEFTQAAIDIMLEAQQPGARDRILANIPERMKQYHGGQ